MPSNVLFLNSYRKMIRPTCSSDFEMPMIIRQLQDLGPAKERSFRQTHCEPEPIRHVDTQTRSCFPTHFAARNAPLLVATVLKQPIPCAGGVSVHLQAGRSSPHIPPTTCHYLPAAPSCADAAGQQPEVLSKHSPPP